MTRRFSLERMPSVFFGTKLLAGGVAVDDLNGDAVALAVVDDAPLEALVDQSLLDRAGLLGHPVEQGDAWGRCRARRPAAQRPRRPGPTRPRPGTPSCPVLSSRRPVRSFRRGRRRQRGRSACPGPPCSGRPTSASSPVVASAAGHGRSGRCRRRARDRSSTSPCLAAACRGQEVPLTTRSDTPPSDHRANNTGVAIGAETAGSLSHHLEGLWLACAFQVDQQSSLKPDCETDNYSRTELQEAPEGRHGTTVAMALDIRKSGRPGESHPGRPGLSQSVAQQDREEGWRRLSRPRTSPPWSGAAGYCGLKERIW